jgi:hypothetical protein
MQARRSSLYVKEPPVIFFEDDFSLMTPGSSLKDSVPSGGSGVWRMPAYNLTGEIIQDPSASVRIHAKSASLSFDVCQAIPDGDLAGITKFRIKLRVFVRTSVGTGPYIGAYAWNGASQWTGLHFGQYMTTSISMRLQLRESTVTALHDSVVPGNKWDTMEVHAEKLSATSLKVGLKHNGAWAHSPSITAVQSGFFVTPNRVTLAMRGGNSSRAGALCNEITIDDQVDW